METLAPDLYSDELVELGNQAWILNCALAELHSFNATLSPLLAIAPEQALRQATQQQFTPACARLRTRLEALLSKWSRRMAEASDEEPVLHRAAWGYRVSVPTWVSSQLRIDTQQVTFADAQRLAAAHPDQLLLIERAPRTGQITAIDSHSEVRLHSCTGVPLNVARMWWSWCLQPEQLYCRLQVISRNLWEFEGGIAVRDECPQHLIPAP